MEIRRGLMMAMANGILSGWAKVTLTATQTMTNAAAVKAWLDTVIADKAFAFVFNDRNMSTTPQQNEFIQASFQNGQKYSAGIRYRNDNYAAFADYTSGYDCIINSGDSVVILYIE